MTPDAIAEAALIEVSRLQRLALSKPRRQQMENLLQELILFTEWAQTMPPVPGHHRNADVMLEQIERIAYNAAEYDLAVQEASSQLIDDPELENEPESDPTCPEHWRKVAERLGVDLSDPIEKLIREAME